MILAIAISSGMMSCSTNAVEDEPTPINPESETRILNIRVVSNDFTRADESGNEINTLYLAFYKGEETTPIHVGLASKIKDNEYSIDIPIDHSKIPDKVVAFANISDEDKIKSAFSGSTIDNVKNEDGTLIMSTALYFDDDNASSKLIYSSTTTYNELISIRLDRVAAKITVNNKITEPISIPNIENYPDLKMNVVGWGVTLTDNSSFLIKQLPVEYSTTVNELQEQFNELCGFSESRTWNISGENIISYAKSINFGKFSETNIPESNLYKMNLSDVNTSFGSSVFVHESTRSKTDLGQPNSKPSIVIVGQYLNGNDNMETFYRLRIDNKDHVFNETEYFNYLSKNQGHLYIKKSGKVELASGSELKNLLILSTPSEVVSDIPDFYVSPQLRDNGNTTLCDKDGNVYKKDNLNKLLYSYFGVLEKYNSGKCVFIVPILHQEDGDNVIYGLVRNHSYKLNINSILGLGRGVGSDNSDILDEVLPELPSTYQVNKTLFVNSWHLQNDQDIVINNTGK